MAYAKVTIINRIGPIDFTKSERFWINKLWTSLDVVLHIPLAETIMELDNFILKGVDLYDHNTVFL